MLWFHILAVAVWIGGAASRLSVLRAAGTPEIGRRLHILTAGAMDVTGMLNILQLFS
ncbi:MAG: hypothetical protein HY712_05415 [candidate division NC10 bacterium]|nr:hypothetical protein [candidate division NC10 bacterium]